MASTYGSNKQRIAEHGGRPTEFSGLPLPRKGSHFKFCP